MLFLLCPMRSMWESIGIGLVSFEQEHFTVTKDFFFFFNKILFLKAFLIKIKNNFFLFFVIKYLKAWQVDSIKIKSQVPFGLNYCAISD